ncbi:MAG: hypothetical protein KBA47_00500 [Caldisericia bacterium]|nr:hypothetical protein [Caldisericia bacterium]
MSNQVMITCRINKELRDKLKYIAEKKELPFSEVIRDTLKVNYSRLNES